MVCLASVDGPTINLPTHQSALKGDKLLVTCHYTSNPAPHEMYWTKQNNGTFRMSGDTLTIPHVHWQDAGNFTCHVTNSLWPTGGKKTEYPAVKTTEVIIECKKRRHWYSLVCMIIHLCSNGISSVDYIGNLVAPCHILCFSCLIRPF